MPANHRHERHHRHGCEEVAYLRGFLDDDEHAMAGRSPNTPSIYRHADNPIGIRKSVTYDAHDDEMQRFSNWGGALSGDVRLLLPIIMGPTILSIYRPGRGELAERTLVDGPWALPLR